MQVKPTTALLSVCLFARCASAVPETNFPPHAVEEQNWNWHLQNTVAVQGNPGFSAQYSGPNSLDSGGQIRETVSLDITAGAHLWPGGEAYFDGLVWQGFGLSDALGVEGFPNGEAFRLGTSTPNFNPCRYFIRHTIGLGGEQERLEDGPLTLAGKRDISRITLTFGRISVKDIFDNNSYANDSRTQFMNWALMANEAWDYPADSLGYITGFVTELNQPKWAVRYGIFQVPRVSNGTALDWHLLEAWAMVTEFERRFTIKEHPGVVRFLSFLNSAHMGSYEEAVDSPIRPANIVATRQYRYKYGFGINVEQELTKNLGAFTRLGWSDGQTEAWMFSDVDRTATCGLSLKGECWNRTNDTFGIAGVFNGATQIHQQFFADGGTGILAGDGALTYGWEKILETYYDLNVWKTIHATFDYQFVNDPAFNRDRGPVSVFAFRLHWTY